MARKYHLIILTVLAVLLIVAIVFWVLPDSANGPASPVVDAPANTPATATPPPPAKMNPQEQLVAIHAALLAANPKYTGRGQFRMVDGQIKIADLSRTNLADASPLKALPLIALDLSENPLADLSSIRGMPLQRLAIEATNVTDLSPLKGMKLTGLYLNRTKVTDLSPLTGMPMEMLNLYETPVKDLAPLKGLPVKFLWLNRTKVSDLTPIAACPLMSLTLEDTPVTDLSPLAGCETLERLHIGGADVTDLTPLGKLKLTRLIFTPSKITKGLAGIRNMKSIREIGLTLKTRMAPDAFWKRYDAGKLR